MTKSDVVDLTLDKLRFYIVDDNNRRRSDIWIVWVDNGSVYVSTKKLGGHSKLSIHPNSVDGNTCQMGANMDYVQKEQANGYGVPLPIRWSRPATPKQGAVCVASIRFPTDYLKANIGRPLPASPKKKIKFALPIAKPGHAVQVNILYSIEHPDLLEKQLISAGITTLGYWEFRSGEFVSVVARQVTFDPKILSELCKGITGQGWIKLRPGETRENCHCVLNNKPKDGEAILLLEINARKVIFHGSKSKPQEDPGDGC